MNCPYCGAQLNAGSQFCPTCGARLEAQSDVQQPYPPQAEAQPVYPPQAEAQPVYPGDAQPSYQYQQPYPYAYSQPYPYAYQQPGCDSGGIPAQYKPLGPWAYFGLNLLFCIPLVGFILLIVFSFSDKNINRRNYARSFWCMLLFVIVLELVAVVVLVSTDAGRELLNELSYYL